MVAAFLLGFTIVAVFEVSRSGGQMFGSRPRASVSSGGRPFTERVLFWMYFACFIAGPFIGAWIAVARSWRPYWGVAMVIALALWLVLGLTPLLVCAVRGRAQLEAFKSKLQRYAGTSFKSLVRVWLFAIAVALFSAARQLFFS